MRSLTRAHSETRKKNEAYDDRRKVPPVTAVISVARCRAFYHRTRAFPYVKHGQPRRQVPQTGRALSGARHSSTVHRPAVHTCMCRWFPRRRHRPDAAETLPKSSGLVPRHPHGHQTMLAAVVGSSRNLLANLGTPDTGIQAWRRHITIAWGFSWIRCWLLHSCAAVAS